ncbi:MAG: peptidoglycan DD-metalloendopeptidase family protein, partial [Peptococcaceae bacterium]|nr:peptidoglycan DD-metalloendopeptidase family protein [Peptococcaceae bacterium]
PLTYGVICPVILLPANQDMSDEELHMVLLHEWNHIRHFDTFWQWVLVAICSIHWFNPLVWMMFVLCRQDMELFCDQAAVRTMSPAQCRAYAYLLLQQAAHGRNTPLFSQFSFTGYQRMEERVKRIMKHKPFSKKALLATVGMLCVGVLCFTTTAMGEVNNTMTIQAEDTQLVWPVVSDDAVITLQSGEQVHPITGETMMIDHICIGGAEKGTDIIASASGVVKEAGYDARNGYYLILQCADDMELHYRHCETLLVTEGTQVQVYDKIATLGQTGDVTGPCLSFAVYQNGEPLYLYSAPAYEAK